MGPALLPWEAESSPTNSPRTTRDKIFQPLKALTRRTLNLLMETAHGIFLPRPTPQPDPYHPYDAFTFSATLDSPAQSRQTPPIPTPFEFEALKDRTQNLSTATARRIFLPRSTHQPDPSDALTLSAYFDRLTRAPAIPTSPPDPNNPLPSSPALPSISPRASSDSSVYETVLSTVTPSALTQSTGVQSQIGATWGGAMTHTMNSGFGSGAPRTEGRKGVREGREKGVGLPAVKGVGRTGKAPAPVPQAMIDALRAEKERGISKALRMRRESRTRPLIEEEHYASDDKSASENRRPGRPHKPSHSRKAPFVPPARPHSPLAGPREQQATEAYHRSHLPFSEASSLPPPAALAPLRSRDGKKRSARGKSVSSLQNGDKTGALARRRGAEASPAIEDMGIRDAARGRMTVEATAGVRRTTRLGAGERASLHNQISER